MSASRSPPKPRTARAASMISAAEAKAAAAAVQRLYRVRDSAGVRLTRTPDVEAPAVETMGAGTAFYGKAEVRASAGEFADSRGSLLPCDQSFMWLFCGRRYSSSNSLRHSLPAFRGHCFLWATIPFHHEEIRRFMRSCLAASG